MKKAKYTHPEFELTMFSTEDILSASAVNTLLSEIDEDDDAESLYIFHRKKQ